MDGTTDSTRTALGPLIPLRTSSKRALDLDQELKAVKKESKRLKNSMDSLNRWVDPTAWFSVAENHVDSLLEECDLEEKKIMDKLLVTGAAPTDEKWKTAVWESWTRKNELQKERNEYVRLVGHYAEESVKQVLTMGVLGAGPSGDMVAKLLLDLDQRPARSSRSSSAQSLMRQSSIEMYNSQEPDGDELWCPIVGQFFPRTEMRAAHIFPYRLGSGVMTLCFGKLAPDEIMSPRNCLMIHKELEAKFYNYLLVIGPVTDDDSSTAKMPTGWQSRILDYGCEAQSVKGTGHTWGQLDKRELIFRSDYRPAARYLYFHYVVSLLYAKKLSRKGWSKTGPKPEKIWATPGRYLRASMLRTLALQVGHDAELPPGCEEGTFTEDVPDQKAKEKEAAEAMEVLLPNRDEPSDQE